jgi:large subunit ribosomal protein L32
MAVPKSKTSKSKRGSRRSHDILKPVNCSYDKKTGATKLQHHISTDGYYNNKQIIAPVIKDNKLDGKVGRQALT